jgi:hypothetical protein
MANQAVSGLAGLVVLAFIVMAFSGCASSEQVAQAPSASVSIPAEEPGRAEFHGAHIASDALRDRLPSES